MRHFVVSTYPPTRDGIARYAEQWVAAARDCGAEVLRVGLAGSGGDTSVDLRGGIRPLKLMSMTHADDSLVLMWHPGYFLSGGPLRSCATYVALGVVMRRRRTVMIVHESDSRPNCSALPQRLPRLLLTGCRAWCWRGATRVTFHTERERQAFVAEFGNALPMDVIPQESAVAPVVREEKARARNHLAIERDPTVLLCIGFLGAHKGFDRAIEAFRAVDPRVARLYVVGSLLDPTAPGGFEYVQALRRLANAVPGVTFLEQYVSDADFDLWLQAADTLVVPYRSGPSSSVLARASAFGVQAIVADVGGLSEQLKPGHILVRDDVELAIALRAAAEPEGSHMTSSNLSDRSTTDSEV